MQSATIGIRIYYVLKFVVSGPLVISKDGDFE